MNNNVERLRIEETKILSLKGKKKKQYEALMQARSEIMDQFKFHENEALNYQKGSAAERSGASTHMADQGSDNFRHDLELGLLTDESEELEYIEEAIQRLVNGEYGACMDCGAKINQARLEVKPQAKFCIKCKSFREENGGFGPGEI